jgi:hypothetical protein
MFTCEGQNREGLEEADKKNFKDELSQPYDRLLLIDTKDRPHSEGVSIWGSDLKFFQVRG